MTNKSCYCHSKLRINTKYNIKINIKLMHAISAGMIQNIDVKSFSIARFLSLKFGRRPSKCLWIATGLFETCFADVHVYVQSKKLMIKFKHVAL